MLQKELNQLLTLEGPSKMPFVGSIVLDQPFVPGKSLKLFHRFVDSVAVDQLLVSGNL